jgi:hypothetical protein
VDIRLDLAGDAGTAIGTALVVLLLCWVVQTMGRVRIANRNAEVWGRLIDKLDPAGVSALLASGSAQTLEAILSGPDRPHSRIIVATQSGIVLVVLAAVMLGYSFVGAGVPSLVGAVTGALGLGLLGAAAAGFWLSQRWGLLPRGGGQHRE